jgi:hypothetical protein
VFSVKDSLSLNLEGEKFKEETSNYLLVLGSVSGAVSYGENCVYCVLEEFLKKLIFFCFKLIFFYVFKYFNVLILKIIFKK